jgi:uncharacterized protein (DUF885 family)
MSKFDHLIDEILEFLWETSPTSATFAGIHKYDHELDHVNRDFLEEKNRKMKDYLTEIEMIKREELNDEEHIDWRLLKNHLESDIKSFEEIRNWEKNPSLYVDSCLYGLFLLHLREFAPIEERAESFLSRMGKIPHRLKDAQHNLRDSPEIYTRLAIQVIESGQGFFKSVIPQLVHRVPKLKSKLENASKQASIAFENYKKFLKDEHLPKSKGDYAIGKELFTFKLAKDHMLSYTADEIFEIGNAAKHSIEEELEKIAQTLEPNKSWSEVVDKVKNSHPEASQLLATYKKEMNAAKKFVKENDIVTIPPDEDLEVMPTPLFNRPFLPYAAYLRPAPFEKEQKGYFYVTPVEESLPQEKKEEILRGHSIYGIPITALHEGYPGHHLQLVLANQVARKLRRLLRTSVFVEGWGLYCEEMMYDAGFYFDPRTVLLKLKDELWRACRVIIDVGLHTKTMDYNQAVDLLVNDAKLERVHAEKEVNRYTFSPTQPLSYLIGKKQIFELKTDYYAKHKADFSLKEFHDRLLSYGSIPVAVIREALGL